MADNGTVAPDMPTGSQANTTPQVPTSAKADSPRDVPTCPKADTPSNAPTGPKADTKPNIPTGPKASTATATSSARAPSGATAKPGDFGVAPKKMTFPASTRANSGHRNTSAGSSNSASSSTVSNVGSISGKFGKLSIKPDINERIPVEAMSPKTKNALVVADRSSKNGLDHHITVKGVPDYSINSQFPPQPIDSKAKPKLDKYGNPEPLAPLAIAYEGVPVKLLHAYFVLAWYVCRGKRSYWNLMHNPAEDVNHLISWAIEDARSPVPLEVNLQGMTSARIVRLMSAAMSMQSERAKKSIEKQFTVLLDYCTLSQTLEAWISAKEYNVVPAVWPAKNRLHAFAWGKLVDTRALPFDDIELLHLGAPNESFTLAAMKKLSWARVHTDISRDSQFQQMDPSAKDAFLQVFHECVVEQQKKLPSPARKTAAGEVEMLAAQPNPSWQNDAPTRGTLPSQPDRYTTIGADPFTAQPQSSGPRPSGRGRGTAHKDADDSKDGTA